MYELENRRFANGNFEPLLTLEQPNLSRNGNSADSIFKASDCPHTSTLSLPFLSFSSSLLQATVLVYPVIYSISSLLLQKPHHLPLTQKQDLKTSDHNGGGNVRKLDDVVLLNGNGSLKQSAVSFTKALS